MPDKDSSLSSRGPAPAPPERWQDQALKDPAEFVAFALRQWADEIEDGGEVPTPKQLRGLAARLPQGGGFVERVRAVARECGYAIGVHGSLRTERDLDLVAIPWTPEAVSADQLVTALCERIPLVERPVNLYADPEGPRVEPNPEPKPWGRWAWSLAGCPQHRYVDLSVAPRAGEPVPIVRSSSSGLLGEKGEPR